MSKLLQSEEKIIIKNDLDFMVIGITTVIMAIAGVRLLFLLLPFDKENDMFSNVFGLAFIIIWLINTVCLGIFAFTSNSKRVTIDRDGVSCESWFNKKFIKWADVKDYGLSYCGQTRFRGNTYYLYFAEFDCPTKNECSKKLKGKMIKTIVIADDYSETVEKVIPFCAEKTDVTAFIGKDKYHSV
ncbi:MAG: hypothetical protein IKU25_08445 [Clostridia bacterium]|nr:hypothetical protein [Clostridia bacterium]